MGSRFSEDVIRAVVFILILASCRPGEEADVSSSRCLDAGSFDPIGRSCLPSEADLPPLPLTRSAVVQEDTLSRIALEYRDSEGQSADQCEILALSPTANLIRNAPAVGPTCRCSAGDCVVELWPAENAYGLGSLFYRLRDANDGFSEYVMLAVRIGDVGDPPVISATTFSLNIDEDDDSSAPQDRASVPTVYRFNMCRLPGFSITEVDSIGDVSLEIVNRPAVGSLGCNDCNCTENPGGCACDFRFDAPNDNGTPYAAFGIRFGDRPIRPGDGVLYSQVATVEVDVSAVNDRPETIVDVDLRSSPLMEDTTATLTLPPMNDVDDTVLAYEIADAANCPMGSRCAGGRVEALRERYGVLHGCLNLDANGDRTALGSADLVCNFIPYADVHAEEIVFYYRAVDASLAASDWVRVSFRVEGINDPPVVPFGFYRIAESKTASALDAGPYLFDLADVPGTALDADGGDLSSAAASPDSYSIVSDPPGASLSGCMDDDDDLDCVFVIDDDNGNFNTAGTALRATGIVSGLTISARHEGSAGNLIDVNILAEDLRARHHPLMTDALYDGPCSSGAGLVYEDCRGYFGSMVRVWGDGASINIDVYLQATRYTTTDTDVQNLINNHPLASRFVVASGATNVAATAATVSLTGGIDAAAGFRIEYRAHDGTAYNAAPNGFISVAVTPTNDTPTLCPISSYERAPGCGLLGCTGHASPVAAGVDPQGHSLGDPLYYYDLTSSTCYRSTASAIPVGGAPAWEIARYLCPVSSSCGGGTCEASGSPVGSVEPSAHSPASPVVYRDASSGVCYRSTGTGRDEWDLMSPAIGEMRVNEGKRIRLDNFIMDEGGSDTAEDAQQIFISRFHSSNETLLSPANVEIVHTLDDRFFACSFSKAACDGSSDCKQSTTGFADPTGNVVPTGHTAGSRLFYKNDLAAPFACYRSTGTGTADWEMVIDNSPGGAKTSFNPVDDGFDIAGGGRTALGTTAGSEDDDVVELVLVPTATKSGTGIISFQLDDGGCQFSVDSADCGGGNCREANMGFANPTNNVVPASHGAADPIVYAANSGDCYVSTGTTAADWRSVDAWPVTSVYFRVTVNPVSAEQGDWKNLAASGPQINKYEEIINDNAAFCPYSLAKCAGGKPCTGPRPPGGGPFDVPAVAADEDFAVYFDSSAGGCYFWNPSSSSQANKWQAFTNYCNIDQSEYTKECYNGSCIFNQAVTAPTALIPSAIGRNYAVYDETSDSFTCYRSYGTGAGQVESYRATASAQIEWDAFGFTGGAELGGYNIFRRLAHEPFGAVPINRSPVSRLDYRYADDAANSLQPPVPGTVYYYEVRPILGGIETKPVGQYIEPRIFVPKSNMSFVHRRIVNRRMCRLMGKGETQIDRDNHNRCPYTGPGDNADGYYDIGGDFHVAMVEAGCPYAVGADADCGTADGNCIADRPPDDALDGADGHFFYDRDSGTCYWKDSGSWGSLTEEAADIADQYAASDTQVRRMLFSELPPISLVSQASASSLCMDDSMRLSDMVPGCAFSHIGCDTTDTRCTDVQDPDAGAGNVTASSAGIYFWNASARTCWRADSTAAGDWNLVGGSGGITTTCPFAQTGVQDPDAGGLNLAASAAGIYFWNSSARTCWLANSTTAGDWTVQTGNFVTNAFAMRLPTRREQIAFSFWGEHFGDAEIASLERGASLGSSGKCNSSSADGLPGYTDVEAPVSAHLYSLPGTAYSALRSVSTGVYETGRCRSLFGIRDIIGNVTEWTGDRASCSLPHSCRFSTGDFAVRTTGASSIITAARSFVLGWYDGNGNGTGDGWATDGYPMGSCSDDDDDDICDGYFSIWPIYNRTYGSGRFIFPLGLPGHDKFPENYVLDSARGSFSKIGASGAGADTFRGDTLEINSHTAYCPYAQGSSDCLGTDCTTTATGRGSPISQLAPASHTAANPVYFYNDKNLQCYVSTGTAAANWGVVGCNYSKRGCAGACNDDASGFNNPTNNVTPSDHTDEKPVVFFDSAGNDCYVSTGTAAADWRAYTTIAAPSAVGVAGGGGYLSGQGAGQFHMELIDPISALGRNDVGFRCVMPIADDFYTQ